MEFRTLNSVPLPASVLGLGCARLGSVLTPSSGAGDHRLIDLALAEGVNFFDTANIYGQGDSERTLGRALRGRRDKVLIVSKGGQRFSPLGRATPLVKPLLRAAAAELPALRRLIARVRRGHVGHSFDRRQLTRSLEESLRRLGTDYLDAYLLHGPPLSTIAREAVFDHLAGLKREGKIRSYGVSCDDADEALAALRAPGVTMIQVPVNVGTVEVIDRFLPAALARGVDVIAREPLMGGAAALRAHDDRPRGEGPSSPVQGAIRFVAGLPGVSVVLCGTTRPEHLRENIAALTAPCPDAAALARLRARFAAAGPPEPAAAKAFAPPRSRPACGLAVMMLDARALPDGHRVHADVCVIGAGAAGITLAHELRDSGLKVALMEAGGRRFDAASQGLYEGEVADDTPHPPPHMYRQRRFGGSTTIWGGRCVPFDGIDFERRDHVPDSGWPIAAAELAPYYLRAQELCEAGPFAYTVAEALPGAPPQMIPGFASDAVTTDRIERYSPPTDFGRRFGRELKAAAKVEVYLHAPCVELLPAHDGRSIGSARFVTGPAGRALTVHARRFVLATGGLEVPRLLLASNSVHAGGIGNHAGHVGRYYMTHIEGTLGVLDLGPANGHAVVDFERTAGDDRIYVRRRLGLSAEAQRRHGLLNFVARLFHESIVDPSHRNGVLSAMYLVKDLILPEYSRKLTTIELSRLAGTRRDARFLMRHLGNIVRDAPGIAAFGLCWAVRRNLARRRIPYVVLRSRTDRYPLDFNAEQSPNPESRVTLGNGRDALGMPRLRIDWRVNEDDYRSVERTYRLLQREFARTGAGRLEFDSDGLLDQIRRGHPVGGHHIGTTRMGDRPADGVVDRDCKVFHTENLFVAGSSVFRTSSHANPTLTIVALATRLADHLRQIGASA